MATRSRPALAGAPWMFALLLSACGGGHETVLMLDSPALFDGQGRPAASARVARSAVPTTRAGLYASPEQLRHEALIAEPYTVVIDLDAAGSPQQALAKALADRAWAQDTRGAAYYVRGSDLQQAAAITNALSDAGFEPVFLVVPPAARPSR